MAKRFDFVTIIFSIIFMAALVILTITSPDTFVGGLGAAKSWVIYHFAWIFIIIVAAITVYCFWLAFSKYGNIRMGRCKPEYGWFGYAAMVFCAAMGSCMIFWPSIEYGQYIIWTDVWPFDWGANEMARYALSYSYFHWGICAWAVYAIGIIPIGYRYFVRKKPGLTLQGGCEGVFGEKLANGWLGTIINIIFIFGILGGLTITYGTGIPMLANFLHVVAGTPETFLVNVLIIAFLTALFTWSAWSGIAKGILNLSRLCIWVSAVMLLLILVLGDTGYIINESVESLGYMFQNFFSMTFNLGAGVEGSNFAAEWTVFYWAWWLGLAPVMWIFIAKCSKGRSVRNIILTVIGAGFVADILFFGVISSNGLSLYQGGFDFTTLGGGNTPLDAYYNTWDNFTFISDTMMATLTAPKLVIAVWFIGTFILLVTTMDSSAYTMAAATQRNVGVNADPVKPLRLFWACMLSVSPLCILGAGAGTSSCTAVVVLTSIPVMILVVIAIIGSTKWMLDDFKDMSAAEIRAFFETEEEKEKSRIAHDKVLETLNSGLAEDQKEAAAEGK